MNPEGINEQWMHWMRLGEFERAWQLSDRVSNGRCIAAPDFRSKRLLVRCENGLGDTIQFVRYVRLLRPLAEKIIVHCQPCLVPLVASMPEIDVVFTWEQPWPKDADLEIEAMQLPHAFRTSVDTIPADVPYFRIDPELVRAKRSQFQREQSFNVGLVWEASAWDERRSAPLSACTQLKAIPGLAIFSLQHGPEWRQALDWGQAVGILNPLEPESDDVMETAAAILNLDLVITVDTMVAHLAGALAKPVWVLLRQEADWRWMVNRADSPWYPTMTLFRQCPGEGWPAVIERVAAALRHARHSSGHAGDAGSLDRSKVN